MVLQADWLNDDTDSLEVTFCHYFVMPFHFWATWLFKWTIGIERFECWVMLSGFGYVTEWSFPWTPRFCPTFCRALSANSQARDWGTGNNNFLLLCWLLSRLGSFCHLWVHWISWHVKITSQPAERLGILTRSINRLEEAVLPYLSKRHRMYVRPMQCKYGSPMSFLWFNDSIVWFVLAMYLELVLP